MFGELLSIQSVSDAKCFTVKYPTARFVTHSFPAVFVDEYETEPRYYELMVRCIEQFIAVREFIKNKKEYLEAKHSHASKGNVLSIRDALVKVYDHYFSVFHIGDDWNTFYDMQDDYYNRFDIVDEVSDLYTKTIEHDPYSSITYQDLLLDYFDGKDELYLKHQLSVKERVDDAIDSCMFLEVDLFIKKILSNATIVFNSDTLTLEYRCSNLLTAMYMMENTCTYNNVEFKKCAHPKCNRYFQVDSLHPQSMCDQHMEARRRKRQNAKAREKNYDEEY